MGGGSSGSRLLPLSAPAPTLASGSLNPDLLLPLTWLQDRVWLVTEAAGRVAEDYEGQRALLAAGLRETARQCGHEPGGRPSSSNLQDLPGLNTPGMGGGGGGLDPLQPYWWAP